MSPAELLLPETADESVPFSARLAARRAITTGVAARPRDRRAHARRRGEDLEWLRSVKLAGAELGATLIDLSEGGALIEVDGPLRPGIKLTLELSGRGLEAAVPLEVLRSYIASLRGGATYYRGACAFAYLIDLPERERAPVEEPFVGADAALAYLLERAAMPGATPTGASQLLLDPRQVVQVLEALHARGSANRSDPIGQHTSELIGAVLPALQRGSSRRAAAAALQSRFQTLPRDLQRELEATSTRLAALIDRCLPSAPTKELTGTPSVVAPPPSPSGQADTAFQKIVVRYADGGLVKGFTQDFHPSRTQFSLWPSINAKPSERVVVPVDRLKAVFFVRDFNGNPAYRERKSFTGRGQGRRIEVTFADTEVILGTTLNYRPDAHGFFVNPVDPASNNTRIFVVAAAVRRVRLV
ncbi:MAG TPA: PilZ domain-containing protein [Vicinamibacterales bacterium]|nr:PilZ domain-containing protein [Vicinamibacterales bacterium]